MKRISGTSFFLQADPQRLVVDVWSNLERILESRSYSFDIDDSQICLVYITALRPKDEADCLFPALNARVIDEPMELVDSLRRKLSLSRQIFLQKINMPINSSSFPTISIGSVDICYSDKKNSVKFKIVPSIFAEGMSQSSFFISANYYNRYILSSSICVGGVMEIYLDCLEKTVEKKINLLYRDIRNFCGMDL